MTSPPRVLFVIPGDGQGSSMIFVRRQAESLAREGLQVDCFYLGACTSPATFHRQFRRLSARIADFRPDLLHAHFGTVTATLAVLAAGTLPLVITYRGSDLNWSPSSSGLQPALGRFLSQLAALRATRIVCVSRGLRDRLWWRRNNVAIIPSSVDAEQFYPQSRSAARARLGWPLFDRVVLFNAGHDPRNKRVDLALQATAIARQTQPNLRLEVLHGDVDPELVPTYMNACDCLLIASDSEGSPTVLQEALACALPVVSVDVGDAIERLRGVSPTQIVSRDPQAIGRALAEITFTPSRSNGPEGIQDVSVSETARTLCRLYQAALGNVARSAVALFEH